MQFDQRPLFSVIITTYNRRDVLPRAMASVLGQTCGAFELLVIDNGSTDDTGWVVERFNDPRIIYLRNPEPSSSCDAPRNLGIQQARGTWVAFLDDDDIWYPERLEKVRRAFEEGAGVAAVCHFENRRVNGDLNGVYKHGPGGRDLLEVLLYEGNCLSSCAMTIRTDLLRELRGFTLKPEFDGAADYDLWIRLAARGARVQIIEEPLGEFCVTGSNWSLCDASFQAKVAGLVKEHLLMYEGKPIYSISRRGTWRLCELSYLAGRSFWRAGDYGNAIRFFSKVAGLLLVKPVLALAVLRKCAGRLPTPLRVSEHSAGSGG